MRDLDKLIVAKGFKKLPKVQKITQSGHTVCWVRENISEAGRWWMFLRLVFVFFLQHFSNFFGGEEVKEEEEEFDVLDKKCRGRKIFKATRQCLRSRPVPSPIDGFFVSKMHKMLIHCDFIHSIWMRWKQARPFYALDFICHEHRLAYPGDPTLLSSWASLSIKDCL